MENKNQKKSFFNQLTDLLLRGGPTQTIVFGLVAAITYKIAKAFANLLDWVLYGGLARFFPDAPEWVNIHKYTHKKAEHLEPWLWSVFTIVFFAIALKVLHNPVRKLRQFFLSYRTSVKHLEPGQGRQGLIITLSPDNCPEITKFVQSQKLALSEICEGGKIKGFIADYNQEKEPVDQIKHWAWQQSCRVIQAHIGNKDRPLHLVVLGSDGGGGSYLQIDTFINTIKAICANSDKLHLTIYKLQRPVNAYDLHSNEDALKDAIKLLGRKSSLNPKNISMDFTSGTKIISVASSMVAVNTDAASVYTYFDSEAKKTVVVEMDTHIKTSGFGS